MSDDRQRIYPPQNWQLPKENAKDWQKGRVGFPADDLIAFINEHKKDSGWINFDLKLGQEDKYYFELDTFVPDPSKAKGANKKEEDSPF